MEKILSNKAFNKKQLSRRFMLLSTPQWSFSKADEYFPPLKKGARGISICYLYIIMYLATTTASAQNFKPDTLILPINIEYATSV
ncbi:MAG: hypothetical protein AAGE93_28635, partial [Bacteroidota bacterium]